MWANDTDSDRKLPYITGEGWGFLSLHCFLGFLAAWELKDIGVTTSCQPRFELTQLRVVQLKGLLRSPAVDFSLLQYQSKDLFLLRLLAVDLFPL